MATGVRGDYVKGNQHQHELALLSRLLDLFKPQDLALGDRGSGGAAWLHGLLPRPGRPLFVPPASGNQVDITPAFTTVTAYG